MIKEFEKYNFVDYIKGLNINFNDFNLSPGDFNHHSHGHGVNHTFRVMLNCLMIGNLIGDNINTKRAFMAAFIHDTAREHDYPCKIHGRMSAEKKLPLFKNMFIKNGMNDDDIDAIKLAVTNHSENFEIEKNNPYYNAVALLRDADGLDLVRIDITVRPDLLRFKESASLIKFAEKLFINTEWKTYKRFSDFLKENVEL